MDREGERLGLLPSADEVQQQADAFFSRWTNVPIERLAADADAQAFIEAWYAEARAAAGMSREDIHALFAAELLVTRLYTFVSSSVPAEELAVHTRHILCSFPDEPSDGIAPPTDEQRAAAQACTRQAQMRLVDGAPFAQVARELSGDAASASRGGDVGWTLLSYLAEAYAEAAETAQIGVVVGPVETAYGLHLIEVLEREMRALSPEELVSAQRDYFALWRASLYEQADIARADTWADGLPSGPGLEALEPQVRAAVERVLARP